MARRHRRALVWLLILALIVYGQSAALVRLLGPSHRHGDPVARAAGQLAGAVGDTLRNIRAWHAQLRERGLGPMATVAHTHAPSAAHLHPSEGGQAQAHDHAAYQRHHHAAGDATVVAVDVAADQAEAQGVSSATSGSLTSALAGFASWAWPGPPDAGGAWVTAPAERWDDAARRLPEHPPRA